MNETINFTIGLCICICCVCAAIMTIAITVGVVCNALTLTKDTKTP